MVILNENTAVKKSNTSHKGLSEILKKHWRHSMLSFLSSLPVSVKDKGHQLYEGYTQYAIISKCLL